MKKEQEQVREFMRKAQHFMQDKPGLAPLEVRKFRIDLIAEELLEFSRSLGFEIEINDAGNIVAFNESPLDSADLTEAYDGILDLLYVVIGAAVTLGLEIEPGWEEVQRSNMTKFIDGYRRDDGKWIKGPSFEPPSLGPIISKQSA